MKFYLDREKVKFLMLERGLSPAKLQEMGIFSHSFLSLLLHEEKPRQIKTINKLAEILKVNPTELIKK